VPHLSLSRGESAWVWSAGRAAEFLQCAVAGINTTVKVDTAGLANGASSPTSASSPASPLRPVASTTPADGGVDLVAGDPDVGQEVIAEALQMPGLTPRPIGSDQRPENGRNGLR
jgi:hypothetical protein